MRDSVGFTANGYFLRPYHYADANGDGIIQQGEVDRRHGRRLQGVLAAARPGLGPERIGSLAAEAAHHRAASTTRAASTCLNNSSLFICQQSPKACQEDQDESLPLWQQARAVAANYGTVVNGTRYTSAFGYYENGQFWRLRELSATLQMPACLATRLRARDANLTFGARNLHVWTKYTGIDPESNYTSGATGLNDVPARFPHAAAEIVLHAPSQPPLLILPPRNDFICRDTRVALDG